MKISEFFCFDFALINNNSLVKILYLNIQQQKQNRSALVKGFYFSLTNKISHLFPFTKFHPSIY